MKIDVVDKTGKKTESMELDNSIFGAKPNEELLTQYVRVYRSNQRQGTSATKTRTDVSGGGRKPWRQKGTGRARHGSIRSPIWVGGGVSHGPQPKSWRLKMPQNQKRKAVIYALSARQGEGKVRVLDSFGMRKPKTKTMVEILENLDLHGKTLIILDKANTAVSKSASNLKKVRTAIADNLNAYQVLDSDNILFVKGAVDKLQKRLS